MNPQSSYPQGGQQSGQAGPQQGPQPSYPPQQGGYGQSSVPLQQPYAVPQPAYAQQPVTQPQSPYGIPGVGTVPPLPATPRKRSKLWVILTFVFIFTTLSALGGGVWALLNYFDQRDNVDSKVTAAVNTAVKEQQDKDAAAFLEKEKQPNRQFAGPDDYGRLSFDYPKTWSVYVAKDDTSGGTYEAYFNPVSVPPAVNTNYFALRVTIEQKEYDTVVKSYENLVKKGDLVSSSITADEQNGTRLDGNFSKDFKGSAVIFKIRDKTVTIRTDAETFKGDFNALLKTITFNK